MNKYSFTSEGIRYSTLSDRGKQVQQALKLERIAHFRRLWTQWTILTANAATLPAIIAQQYA